MSCKLSPYCNIKQLSNIYVGLLGTTLEIQNRILSLSVWYTRRPALKLCKLFGQWSNIGIATMANLNGRRPRPPNEVSVCDWNSRVCIHAPFTGDWQWDRNYSNNYSFLYLNLWILAQCNYSCTSPGKYDQFRLEMIIEWHRICSLIHLSNDLVSCTLLGIGC